MIKKFTFIAVAKTRKKMDNFGANSDINVTVAEQILRFASC
jgi:hypothetical protein